MKNTVCTRLFILLFTLLTGQAMSAQTPFDWQAHRGGRGIMPENSLPAFRKALQLGVPTLELDVVISKDKQVVVSHEPFFSAEICTDAQGRDIAKGAEKKLNIYQMDYAAIRAFDCGSKGNRGFPEQQKTKTHKPLLTEVLAMAEAYCRENNLPPVQYNIEIKSTPEGDGVFHPAVPEYSRLVHEAIEKNVPLGRVILQSFDFRVLKHWHTQYPAVRLAALVANVKSVEENLAEIGFTPQIYSPYYKLLSDKGKVDKLHDLGMKVIPWTVNETDDMRRLKAWGVDGIITDYPNRTKEI